jgi:hypothetical protein
MTENAFVESLPEDLRSNEALSSYQDAGSLATDYLALKEASGKQFREGLSEELRGNADLESFDSPGALAQAFLDLKGAQPTIPEEAGAYEIPLVQGQTVNEALVNGFRETALEAKLTQDQVTSVANFWNGFLAQVQEADAQAAEKKMNAAADTLKTEWGPDYDKNVKESIQAFMHFAGEEGKEWAETTGMGNDPVLVKVFHAVRGAFSEDIFEDPSGCGDVRPLGEDGKPVLSFPSMK